MDFSSGIRKRRKLNTHALSDLYPHDLQLFSVPPQVEISLAEFEDLALERLQLLRILEQANYKGHRVFTDEWMAVIKSDLIKENLPHFRHFIKASGLGQTDLDFQARRADHISHYILRLAYCQSEDLRRWYIAREQEWFKFKFLVLNSLGKSEVTNKFLELNHLHYTQVTKEEKDELREILYSSTTGVYDVDNTQFYKIRFIKVLPLVKARKVYISKGCAYVPHSELITCILTTFRAQLSKGLTKIFWQLPFLDDDRLSSFLSILPTGYVGETFEQSPHTEDINIHHLDKYSKERFPPCMRYIHETFRANHHMRHSARLQYGLFLKGIGLLYEDAVRFWQEEFGKIMDANTFEKKYSYAIKHMYGKSGRMVSYSPYSCKKIISSNVGPGEHHGCMFRHFDSSVLKQKLIEHGINSEGVEEILQLTKNNHFEIACTKYFHLTQGLPSKKIITHPNDYYEEALQVVIEKLGKTDVKTKLKKSSNSQVQTTQSTNETTMELSGSTNL